MPSAEGVAESNISSTRQSYNLPSAYRRHLATKRHSAKICFAECLFTDTRQTCLCRVPTRGHSANTSLPSATQLALGKHCHVTRPLNVTVIVCRVPGCGTRQRFINAECNYNGTRHSDSLPSVLFSSRRNNKFFFPTQSKLFP